jgi:hypothetical protein
VTAADSGTHAEAAADAEAASAGCDLAGDPKSQPCLLDDAYGVFVAPPGAAAAADDAGASDAGTDGSKDHPFATLGEALAQLGAKTRIFLCNGSYSEELSITTPVRLYGGLSCAPGPSGRAWAYVGATSTVTSPSPRPALSVSGASGAGVTLEDVSFTSPSVTTAGGSSIAAIVSSSTVNLVRVTLTAGSGAGGSPGEDGTATPNYTGAAPAGGGQVFTFSGGSYSAVAGGGGAVNRCTPYGMSAGGDGGLGCASSGTGASGNASPPAPTTPGRDGLSAVGTTTDDAGTLVVVAITDPGADGVAGDGGAAAAAPSYGVLTATAWTPAPGGDGAPGHPGQGGAGATDPRYDNCGLSFSVGGGGGGAGGCGGSGGKGGGGAGGSIALAVAGSTVTLTDCILVASAGGAGGRGGAGEDGQAGAAGGDRSVSLSLHAAGAPGGNGAGGSGGAGGTGGISVGILTKGSTVTTTSGSIQTGGAGTGGAAGPAGHHTTGPMTTGMDGTAGASGTAGTSAARLDLP